MAYWGFCDSGLVPAELQDRRPTGRFGEGEGRTRFWVVKSFFLIKPIFKGLYITVIRNIMDYI